MKQLPLFSMSGGLILIVFVVSPLCADIFVSGDLNITDDLRIDLPGNSQYGSQQFFANILRGGSKVAVLEQEVFVSNNRYINEFYNSLDDVDSFIMEYGSFEQLNGVDLFIVMKPDYAFSDPQLNAMRSLLDSGGSIFFVWSAESVGNWRERQISKIMI